MYAAQQQLYGYQIDTVKPEADPRGTCGRPPPLSPYAKVNTL